jgi:two-component system response regulator AtoC
MKRILIVDDDRQMRRTLQIMMERLGYASAAVADAAAGLEQLRSEHFDLVLTDLRMPHVSGIEFLEEIHRIDSDLPVIVVTAYGTIQTAIEAMQKGAADYVLKPFDNKSLAQCIGKALDLQVFRAQNRFLKRQVGVAWEDGAFLHALPGMSAVRAVVDKVAPASGAVLVTGETGVGKELIARSIHELSPRREALFVPVNCAALPPELLESELFGHARGAFTGAHQEREGKFELANGGTLFLDEIGDMPLALQAKLLRVLEEKVIERLGSNKRVAVDMRIVSATNQDLAAAVRAKAFREDLLYRINTFQIDLPPLRERPGDVGLLAKFFLDRFCKEVGKQPMQLADGAVALLERYAWPGNVRELRNVMERAAVLAPGPSVGAEFFGAVLPHGAGEAPLQANADDERRGDALPLPDAVSDFERRMILRALDATGDNKAEAARRLGVSERNLWYKLKKHGL